VGAEGAGYKGLRGVRQKGEKKGGKLSIDKKGRSLALGMTNKGTILLRVSCAKTPEGEPLLLTVPGPTQKEKETYSSLPAG